MKSLWTTNFRNKQYFCIAVKCNLIRVKHRDPILCMTWVYLRKDILPQILWNFEVFTLIESIQAISGDEHRTFQSSIYFGYSAHLKWSHFFRWILVPFFLVTFATVNIQKNPMLIPEKTLKAINTENFKLIAQILQEISFLKVGKSIFEETLI